MRPLALIAIALLCCATLQAATLLTAYEAATPPAIDGNLSDACWQAAAPTSAFVLWGRDALPEAQTVARVSFGGDRLYIAIEAMEPNLDPRLNMLDSVKANATERDGAVFGDDCVEIFIQPGDADHYQLAVNSNGALYDGKGMDGAWNGDCEVAARRGDSSYTFELAIGLDSIGGVPEGTWRMNFCRNRTAVPESSTWSGLQGAFHQPAQFGEVRFAPAGPRASGVSLQLSGDAIVAGATLTGAAPSLSITAAAGDQTVQRSVSGTGQQSLQLPLPPGAASGGSIAVAWELSDGEAVVQRSAPIPLAVEGDPVLLSVGLRQASARAWLNGSALAAGEAVELDLQPGLNILALRTTARGDEPSVAPAISVGGRSLPVRWLRRTDEPEGAWTQELPGEGWLPAEDAWPDGAARQWLVCGLYAGEPKPQLFPNADTFFIPRGSRQLMRLYAHIPSGVPTEGYRMVVDVPSALQPRAVEADGSALSASAAGSWSDDGVAMTRYHVDYDSLPGEGMEISLRWGSENNTTTAYEPSLTSGGTHDWRHMSMEVIAPDNAYSVHPLIIKWQGRGITGTFCVDNLVFRRADSDENLLKMGSFDEREWGSSSKLQPEGPDGSLCVKMVCRPQDVDKQNALWVDPEDVIPVAPGERYVVEMDVKCEDLVSPSAKPQLGLLFEASRNLSDAPLPIYTACQVLDGLVTEIPRRSNVQPLPPLRNVRPQSARITPCYGSRGVTAPEVVQAWADNTWASGMTWIWGNSGTNVAQALLPRGLKVIYHLPWGGWNPVGEEMRAFADEHPEFRALSFEGNREASFFCPTWMLSEEGAEVRRMLQDWVRSSVSAETCSNVNWDLEQPVVDPPTFCTCERCIEAFRQRADVPDDAQLTPETLLGEYRDRWVNFRCQQNAEAAAILAEAVHSVDPDLEFSVYSGFQSKRTMEHYGVDWALMQPNIDMAIAGYGGSLDTVRATLEAMGGKPLMGGEMWYLSHRDDSRATPNMRTWRNRLLRQFVWSGCTGVLIWHLAPMEGGSFYATSEATEFIAENEEWLREDLRCDERVTVEGIHAGDWAAFEYRDRIRVLLLSFVDEPKQVTVTASGRSREIELGPHRYEVVVLR